jgi:hypothetical protein
MAYINPAPGTANQVTLTLDVASSETDVTQGMTTLAVPALQDMTINASNDVFTWSQLDSTAKKQIATTSTNSISMNIVVDTASFFGTDIDAPISGTIVEQGLFGCSRNKTLINFSLRVENATTDTFIKGVGYITGLAPTISADSPVWVSPITITVSGEYTVATS